jgi:hypothetical protein
MNLAFRKSSNFVRSDKRGPTPGNGTDLWAPLQAGDVLHIAATLAGRARGGDNRSATMTNTRPSRDEREFLFRVTLMSDEFGAVAKDDALQNFGPTQT